MNTVESTCHHALFRLFFGVLKFAITGACLWYVLRQINASEIIPILSKLDYSWAVFSTLVIISQIPVVASRLFAIARALAVGPERLSYRAATVVAAIGVFFTQVLPNVLGEGIRFWLLCLFGCPWRNALATVMLDRGIGVGMLVIFAFPILLLPSALTALGGYRDMLLLVFGTVIVAGAVTLAIAPRLVYLLQRWNWSRSVGAFALDTRGALLGPWAPIIFGSACTIHFMTIVAIWLLNWAFGLSLPVLDAAVLFVAMIGVALVPVSVGGWGLREVAVVSILSERGIAPEQALVFSLCFGLVMMVASLPGGIVWLLYRLPRKD